MAAKKQLKGACECCGNSPRVLTAIDSGQKLCRTCLRELRPPRPKHLATRQQIQRARRSGLEIPDDITKDDLDRMKQIKLVREVGLPIPDDITKDDLDRIVTATHDIYLYMFDVWEAMTKTRLTYQGVDRCESSKFAAEIVWRQPDLARRAAAIQRQRKEIALANMSEVDKADSFRFSKLWKTTPKLERNAEFNEIWRLLQSRFTEYLPNDESKRGPTGKGFGGLFIVNLDH